MNSMKGLQSVNRSSSVCTCKMSLTTETSQELEAMLDPTRKEALAMRKKIDMVNRELKLLSQSCLKKACAPEKYFSSLFLPFLSCKLTVFLVSFWIYCGMNEGERIYSSSRSIR